VKTPGAWKKLVPAALALAAAAVWLTGLDGELVFDDEFTVGANTFLGAVSRPLDLFRAPAASPFRDRPVTAATFQASYLLGGRAPWAYRLLNIVIHILAALTLYGIVRRSLAGGRAGPRLATGAPAAAAVAALLWALHPLQTESVTYITQRCEALAGLFYLLTLYLVIRGSVSPRPGAWYAGAVGACLLGVGSKATAVTAPLAVLLYDRVFLSRSWREVWARRRLYLGLAVSWVVLGALVAGTDYPDIRTHGVGEYLRTQPAILLHYLRLAVLPDRLCLNYNWAPAGWGAAFIPGLALLGLLAAAAALWRFLPPAGYACAWTLLALAPTSSVFPLEDLAFEHRVYLALAGPAALVGCWGYLLFSRSRRRALGIGIAAGVLAALSARTVSRNRDYRAAEGLWRQCLSLRPINPRAHNNLGNLLLRRGLRAEALAQYRAAVASDPGYEAGLYNLGNWYLAEGDPAAAERWFRLTLEVNPHSAAAANNLAIALFRRGRTEEAEALLVETERLHPADPAAPYNLGVLMLATGREDRARLCFARARELDPDKKRRSEYLAVPPPPRVVPPSGPGGATSKGR